MGRPPCRRPGEGRSAREVGRVKPPNLCWRRDRSEDSRRRFLRVSLVRTKPILHHRPAESDRRIGPIVQATFHQPADSSETPGPRPGSPQDTFRKCAQWQGENATRSRSIAMSDLKPFLNGDSVTQDFDPRSGRCQRVLSALEYLSLQCSKESSVSGPEPHLQHQRRKSATRAEGLQDPASRRR